MPLQKISFPNTVQSVLKESSRLKKYIEDGEKKRSDRSAANKNLQRASSIVMEFPNSGQISKYSFTSVGLFVIVDDNIVFAMKRDGNKQRYSDFGGTIEPCNHSSGYKLLLRNMLRELLEESCGAIKVDDNDFGKLNLPIYCSEPEKSPYLFSFIRLKGVTREQLENQFKQNREKIKEAFKGCRNAFFIIADFLKNNGCTEVETIITRLKEKETIDPEAYFYECDNLKELIRDVDFLIDSEKQRFYNYLDFIRKKSIWLETVNLEFCNKDKLNELLKEWSKILPKKSEKLRVQIPEQEKIFERVINQAKYILDQGMLSNNIVPEVKAVLSTLVTEITNLHKLNGLQNFVDSCQDCKNYFTAGSPSKLEVDLAARDWQFNYEECCIC